MIKNVHERRFPWADRAAVGALLDTAGQPDDRIWPNHTGHWPPMRLRGPLQSMPAGGHGLVRYRVVAYEPGERIVFRFDDRIGLVGTHTLEVIDGPGLRHTIDARPTGVMRLLWPTFVRWAHDACLEELLDRASIELGRPPATPYRVGWYVRLLLAIGPSPAREERLAAAKEGSAA